MLESEKGRILLLLARSAIAERFGESPLPFLETEWLQESAATFITLTLRGQLRGCIGSLEAHRPLIEDVRTNAVAAALRDPRFAPLSAEEFANVSIEVSLLSVPQPMRFDSEQDALSRLRAGVDGVILEYGLHRSTFLPQVWEQLPDKKVFMAHLKNKAGLPENFWSDEIKLSRYTVKKWREGEPHG
jgi:AmmeMemoRadiSam system protein A